MSGHAHGLRISAESIFQRPYVSHRFEWLAFGKEDRTHGSGDIRSGHCHGWNINLGMHAQAHKPILPDGVSRYVLIYQGFAA